MNPDAGAKERMEKALKVETDDIFPRLQDVVLVFTWKGDNAFRDAGQVGRIACYRGGVPPYYSAHLCSGPDSGGVFLGNFPARLNAQVAVEASYGLDEWSRKTLGQLDD